MNKAVCPLKSQFKLLEMPQEPSTSTGFQGVSKDPSRFPRDIPSGDPGENPSDKPIKYPYQVPIIKPPSAPCKNQTKYPSHGKKELPSANPRKMMIKSPSGDPTGALSTMSTDHPSSDRC